MVSRSLDAKVRAGSRRNEAMSYEPVNLVTVKEAYDPKSNRCQPGVLNVQRMMPSPSAGLQSFREYPPARLKGSSANRENSNIWASREKGQEKVSAKQQSLRAWPLCTHGTQNKHWTFQKGSDGTNGNRRRFRNLLRSSSSARQTQGNELLSVKSRD